MIEATVLISFEHKGVVIFNPFIAESGNRPVSPAHYGFKVVGTGGGCEALIRPLPDGRTIWLTDLGGLTLPVTAEDALIGLFSDEGEQLECHRLPTADDLEQISSGAETAELVVARLREELD